MRSLLLLIVGLLAAFPVHAQEKGVDALLKALAARTAGIDTLTYDLTQERRLAIFKRPVIFQGRMALAKPDRLRLTFTAPMASVLVLNRGRGSRCADGAPPVSFTGGADPGFKVLLDQMAAWMVGDFSRLSEFYQVALASSGVGLVMTPVDPALKKNIARVELAFDPESLHPRRIGIHEPDGDSTLWRLRNVQDNPPLADALFAGCGLP